MKEIQEEDVGLKGCVRKLMEVDSHMPLFPAGYLEPKFAADYAQGGMYFPQLFGNLHPWGWCLHMAVGGLSCVARIVEVQGPSTFVINSFPEVNYAEHNINPPVQDAHVSNTEVY
jgi:hypothetical protein